MDCCICLEQRILHCELPCHHKVCPSCMAQLPMNTCPLCRSVFDKDDLIQELSDELGGLVDIFEVHDDASSSSSSSDSSLSSSSSDSSSSSSSSASSSNSCCNDSSPNSMSTFNNTTNIYNRFRGALVRIRADTVISGKCTTITGYGVFLEQHLILTSSALCLVSPLLLQGDAQRTPASSHGPISEVTVHSRIIVDVLFPDNDRTFPYKATVLYVDGAGGYGLLTIDPCLHDNINVPRIQRWMPYFKLGPSRKLKAGDSLYLLTDTKLIPGVLENNRYHDSTGTIPCELITGIFEPHVASLGMPILNSHGSLVGLYLKSEHHMVTSISEHFMSFGLRSYIRGKSIKEVSDLHHGSFWKRDKGFLDINYQFVTSDHLITKTVNGIQQPLFNREGNLYDGPQIKQVIGVHVSGPDFVPGTHLVNAEGLFFGNEKTNTIPPLLTFNMHPGDQLTTVIRVPSYDDNGCPNPNHLDISTQTFTLKEFPALHDYPWYITGAMTTRI